MAKRKAARSGGRRSGGSTSRRGSAQRKSSASASSRRKTASSRQKAAAARKSPSRQRTSTRGSRDPSAIQLLKQDHREVEQLFERFEEASEREKAQIARQVCAMLTVHAQIEEELVYPAAKQALEEDDQELVDEANVEHASAKDLIAQIEGGGESDELFDAKVKVLGEYIKHHVKEEEGELFPKLKQTDLDLESLGSQLASRKAELTGALGLESDGAGEDESDLESNLNPSRGAGNRGNRPTAGR